ncbi:MAG: hypothetical protein FWE88_09650 [Phycisphaerae bacterium]|nr:hypothetical protein [Phycisphaerae bacterium]
MQVLCGQCGSTLTVADTLAGGVVACPHCARRLTLPSLGPAASGPLDAQEVPPDEPLAPAEGGGFAESARQTVNKKIPVECAVCHKSYAMGGRVWGTTVKCPSCGMALRVPHPDEQREDEFTPRRVRGPAPPDEPPPFDLPPYEEPVSPDADFSFASFTPDNAPTPQDKAALAELASELASFAELAGLSDFEGLSDQLRFDDDPVPTTKPAAPSRREPREPASKHHAPPQPAKPKSAPMFVAPSETTMATAATETVEVINTTDADGPAATIDGNDAPQKRPATPPTEPKPADKSTARPTQKSTHRPAQRRRGLPVWVFYAVVVVLAGVLAVLTPRMLSYLSHGGAAADNATNDAAPTMAALDATDPADNAPPPDTTHPAPTTPPANAATEIARNAASNETATPATPTHAIAIAQARRDAFVANGYLAAPLGKLFLKLRVDVQAGPANLTLDPAAANLACADGTSIACRGFEPPEGRLPAWPTASPKTLAPGENQSVTLVFEVPQEHHLDGARLDWPDVGQKPVPPIRQSSVLANEWDGPWAEQPPRNLRPLPHDPLRADVQQATRLTLALHQRADQYDVTLAPLGLQGLASPTPHGDLHVELRRDNQSLPVTLRLIDNGRAILLYLDDEPMRQITFGRQ